VVGLVSGVIVVLVLEGPYVGSFKHPVAIIPYLDTI